MRRGISLSLIILLSAGAFAQIKIGMKLSPQFTWASSDNKNSESSGIRLNAAYGVMIDYYFSEHYAIGTEFCVNSYGANVNIKKDKYLAVDYAGVTYPNTDAVKFDYRVQYMQIPVLIKMRTNEANGMRYYAEFGFGMGFLFKSKADVTFGATTIENVDVNTPDPSDEYIITYGSGSSVNKYSSEVSGFRGSMILGGGIMYTIKGNSSIIVGLRYDNGLSSFLSDDKLQTSLSYLSLNCGLIF